MRTLLRRLSRFVFGLLTAILKAIGREPLCALHPVPESLPIRRTIRDDMTPCERAALRAQLGLQVALANAHGRATGKMILLDERCA